MCRVDDLPTWQHSSKISRATNQVLMKLIIEREKKVWIDTCNYEKKEFTSGTLARSTSFDFRFLIFGDSSKKRSDPGARPRPSIGVSGAVVWTGGAEVLVEREFLRLTSFSCAFRSSEADSVGFLSSSGLSEKIKNIIDMLSTYWSQSTYFLERAE